MLSWVSGDGEPWPPALPVPPLMVCGGSGHHWAVGQWVYMEADQTWRLRGVGNRLSYSKRQQHFGGSPSHG